METQRTSPIFIHSLFRSGSTYLFSVFRRSDSNYWCYQEPLNEKLIFNATKPGGFLVGVEGAHKILRHPKLEKPHCYEFNVVTDEVLKHFHKEFSYDQYFIKDKEDFNGIKAYFTALKDGSKGRPVFQCCRTTGRVPGLSSALGGIHIFLHRNPWDQWWSYKKDRYFDSRNLFISNAKLLPDFLQELKKELQIPELHKSDPSIKHAYCTNRRLDSSGSYKLFYSLWCHAILDAKPSCDVSIDIDHLSTSNAYRDKVINDLQLCGIDGIDVTDCSVPMAKYGENDSNFFCNAEDHIHNLLLSHGYSSKQVDELIQLSTKRKQLIFDTSAPENFAIRDAMRAREYLRQAETELSEMQNMLFKTRAQAQQAEIRARQAEAKADQSR